MLQVMKRLLHICLDRFISLHSACKEIVDINRCAVKWRCIILIMDSYREQFDKINEMLAHIDSIDVNDHLDSPPYIDRSGDERFQQSYIIPSIFAGDHSDDVNDVNRVNYMRVRNLASIYYSVLTTGETVQEEILLEWFSLCINSINAILVDVNCTEACRHVVDMIEKSIDECNLPDIETYINEFHTFVFQHSKRELQECRRITEDMLHICTVVYYTMFHHRMCPRLVRECIDGIVDALIRQKIVLVKTLYSTDLDGTERGDDDDERGEGERGGYDDETEGDDTDVSVVDIEEIELDRQYPELEWDSVEFPAPSYSSGESSFESDDDEDYINPIYLNVPIGGDETRLDETGLDETVQYVDHDTMFQEVMDAYRLYVSPPVEYEPETESVGPLDYIIEYMLATVSTDMDDDIIARAA